MTLLGPNGQPITEAKGDRLFIVQAGVGAEFAIGETFETDAPGGGRIRFLPGRYVVIEKGDLRAMLEQARLELPT